jgi:hypothetical protein
VDVQEAVHRVEVVVQDADDADVERVVLVRRRDAVGSRRRVARGVDAEPREDLADGRARALDPPRELSEVVAVEVL